jgi:hypothetical protein
VLLRELLGVRRDVVVALTVVAGEAALDLVRSVGRRICGLDVRLDVIGLILVYAASQFLIALVRHLQPP